MKFKKMTDKHGIDYWFCGEYKISQYTWHNGSCEPYYQVYKIIGKQWGNYINRSKQYDKKLTFQECVDLARSDFELSPPTSIEVKRAEQAAIDFCGV